MGKNDKENKEFGQIIYLARKKNIQCEKTDAVLFMVIAQE